MMNFRYATKDDVALILRFIKELAEYEGLLNEVVADEKTLEDQLFNKKNAEVIFATEDGKEVGFALFSTTFRPSSEDPDSTSKISTSRRNTAAKVTAKPFSKNCRKSPSSAVAADLNGGASTKTDRVSTSISPSAPKKWTNGRSTAFRATP